MHFLRLALPLVLAALSILAATGAAAVDLEGARQIVSRRCFICHGMNGESSSESFPRLATQNAAYLSKQLRDFLAGRRKSPTMKQMAAGLTEAEIVALGAFFAAQKADPHPVADASLAAAGRDLYARGNPASDVPPCASCHGPKAEGSESLPRLAGQQAAYIESQLRQFNQRSRTNDNEVMHAIASRLTEPEIKALAEYLATTP